MQNIAAELRNEPTAPAQGLGTLTVIVGLPASGKSHFLDERRSSQNDPIVAHDFLAQSVTGLCRDALKFTDIALAINNGTNCIIADIAFCYALKRQELEGEMTRRCPGVNVRYIYFENSPTRCIVNARYANRHDTLRRIALIEELSSGYEIRVEHGLFRFGMRIYVTNN